MRDGGGELEGVMERGRPCVADWAAAVERMDAPAVLLCMPDGSVAHANPAARVVLEGAAALDALVADPGARATLRDRVLAGLPWIGELRPGLPAVATPIPGESRVAAALVQVCPRPEGRPEIDRLRGCVRRRDAEHAVALAVGHGVPTPDLARTAAEELARVLPVREARVSLLEADTVRVLARRRDGPPLPGEPRALLASSPAALARARRAPVQLPIAEAVAAFPALRGLEVEGVRSVLYVPLEVAEAVFGFVELHGAADGFTPEEVDLAASMAGMVAAGIVRERLMEQATRHAQAMEMRAALGREELDRTQEQLLQAAKLSSIGELAAGLVHEINQPLNVLGGYVELLREGSLAPTAQERALDVMARAVDRMSSMVDNLRNFARGGGPSVVVVDVATVVNMARELTVGALKRGVKVDCAPGLTVLADANRLEQVFINLLANALQCDGDPVTVSARDLADDRVAVEVSDRGPGVPEPLRQRIFEPFFTTKPPGQGTGLGLSVSARIVQDLGGRIEVDDNPGGGAVFRVVLPRHRPRGAEAPS